MRLVGGNLALDLVNTRTGPPDGPWSDDAVTSYQDLVAWSVYAGALTEAEAVRVRREARADPDGAQVALARALAARDHLDEVFRAVANGAPAAERALAALRDDEVEGLAHARPQVDGALTWSWQDDRTLLRPVHASVHAGIELLAGGSLSRVKQCGGCTFLFHDETKNLSRRWCSMEDCGKSEKIRRYVAARRARTRAR